MSIKRILATSIRILLQLRHDHRTVGLVFLMPAVLITILYFVFEGRNLLFESITPLLLGMAPFILMFVVSSVAVLRERTSGTLERLLVSPTTRLEIIVGYAVAFALLAIVQSLIAVVVALGVLEVSINGAAGSLILVAMLSGVLGMAFGLLFSAFAKNEFQAVQFMPAFVFPQFLTCGLFLPREQMAEFLQYFASIMPLTYVIDAMEEVRLQSQWSSDLTISVVVIIGFILLALGLGALSLRSN